MFRKIIQTLGTNTLAAISNLLLAILVSRVLGAEGKGVQGLLVATISLVLILSNLAGGATLVYLAPRLSAGRILYPAYAWALFTCVLAYPIIYFAGLVSRTYTFPVCALSFLWAVLGIHGNFLVGRKEIGQSNLLSLLQPTFLLGLTFLLFIPSGNRSIASYILAMYITLALCLAVSIWMVYRRNEDFSFLPLHELYDSFRQMFRLGFYNQAAHITQLSSFRLGFYVLEKSAGMAAVGIYSNSASLTESIWLIAKSISLVQYSYIANQTNREEPARVTILFLKAALAVSLLASILLAVLPGSLYSTVFGPGFACLKSTMLPLLPGTVLYVIAILMGHYFSGTGRYKVNAGISAMGLLISVALYFVLVPGHGTIGAAWAATISYTATAGMFLYWFAHENPGWHMQLKTGTSSVSRLIQTYLNKK